MKITEEELNIKEIIFAQLSSREPIDSINSCRHSDCFVYVLSGSVNYIFEDTFVTAKAGDVVYLANNSKYHVIITDENFTYIVIEFFFANPDNVIFENRVYSSKSIAMLENKFQSLCRYWKIGNFSEKIYCKSILYQIYSEIAKSEFSLYVTKDRRNQIEKIAEYISENISNPELSVAYLSKICSISEVHFRRIFNCIYHTSPIKFITNLRIKKAEELLSSTPLSIGEISKVCGFENQYYFSKIFKAENKMTPSEYRKNNNNRL